MDRLRARLGRAHVARLEMVVIVAATGLAGFAASTALLAVGMTLMTLRYPIAALAAYGAFIGLVRLWVSYHQRRVRDGDGVLLVDDVPIVDGVVGDIDFAGGGGGGFGGGGASAGWTDSPPTPAAASASGGDKASVGDVLDLDDGWIIVVPIILAAVSLFAAIYIIWVAPTLLAEVALDVALAGGLYRRLTNIERRWWVLSAVRKTWIPAVVVIVFLTAGGAVMHAVVPKAHTIGEVVRAAG